LTKRVLVIPDTHISKANDMFDPVAWRAVKKYARDHKWDQIVHLGDILDMPQLAFYNKGKAVEMAALQPDFDEGQRFLDELQELGPVVLIEGNHDTRFHKYLSTNPRLRDSMSFEDKLGLKTRGIKFVPYYQTGAVHKIGPCLFGHGI